MVWGCGFGCDPLISLTGPMDTPVRHGSYPSDGCSAALPRCPHAEPGPWMAAGGATRDLVFRSQPASRSARGAKQQVAEESAGVWLLLSLMNHSCSLNAHAVTAGDTVFVRASRDIKRGAGSPGSMTNKQAGGEGKALGRNGGGGRCSKASTA